MPFKENYFRQYPLTLDKALYPWNIKETPFSIIEYLRQQNDTAALGLQSRISCLTIWIGRPSSLSLLMDTLISNYEAVACCDECLYKALHAIYNSQSNHQKIGQP